MAVRIPFRSLEQRGISPIVGEIMMIAIITVAMSTIAYFVLAGVLPPERFARLDVRVENASTPPTQSLRVVLFHVGGDPLGIPARADDEFRVVGGHLGENSWENVVPWDNWSFSDPANGFGFGENAVGYLRHDDATMRIGDKVYIRVNDLYSDKLIYHRTLTVENSALYV